MSPIWPTLANLERVNMRNSQYLDIDVNVYDRKYVNSQQLYIAPWPIQFKSVPSFLDHESCTSNELLRTRVWEIIGGTRFVF